MSTPPAKSAKIDRVSCFVDGFNLYHSIDDLRKPHLKWLNLWQLADRFVLPATERLTAVHYFSAFADWLPDAKRRHQAYVRALVSIGINAHMGNFKNKGRKCPRCGHRWIGHEEKETDVSIGVTMLMEAFRDRFDKVLLITRDSDLTPAVRLLRSEFQNKGVYLVAPPHRGHSVEMLKYTTGKYKITLPQMEASLFPAQVQDSTGRLVATRPTEYDPPTT